MRQTIVLAGLLVLAMASSGSAQQVYIQTPFQQLNDSFYENYNIGWGYNGRRPDGSGFFFNSIGPAPPPFGRHDPNADGHIGIGNGRGFFNFSFGQGNSRSMSTQTPSVMVPNGHGGSVSNTSIRPFVTGIIPVVGGLPATPPPSYISPLGANREQIYQNVQRIQEQMLVKQLQSSRADQEREAEALAAERARLKARTRSGVTSDDPPLKLNGQ